MSQDFFEFIIQNPNIFAGKNHLHQTIWRLSTNPQLTFDQLRLISEAWNFPMSKYFPNICKNPNINWEIVENTINDYPWNFQFLSENNNFNWDIISNNREFNWNFYDLAKRLPWEVIHENPNENWVYSNISQYNKNVDFEIIKQNPEKPWNLVYFQNNPNLKLEYLSHPLYSNLPIYKDSIVKNSSITIEEILGNYDFLNEKAIGTWANIILNRYFELDHYIKHKDLFGLNENMFSHLSINPNVTYDIVKTNNHFPWNKYYLANNPNFLLNDILAIDLLNLPNSKNFDYREETISIDNCITATYPSYWLAIPGNPMNEPYRRKYIYQINNWYKKLLPPSKWVPIRKGEVVRQWFDSPDCRVANRLRENWFHRGILKDILGY